MKYYIGQFVAIALAFLTGFSCESKKEMSSSVPTGKEEAHEELFLPNPQIIEEQVHETLAINAKAPDFRLPGVDNHYYTLENFADADVLVIIFISNHCTTSQAYEDRIIELAEDYRDEGVQIVAISPNSILTGIPNEHCYSELGDSFDEMKIRAGDKNFNFPYLYDGDNQQTAVKYGPTATPHAFVFNRDRRLKYKGRLDDSKKPGTAFADDLRAAIDAVLLNVEILMPERNVEGCEINWAWKTDRRAKADRSWENEPVFLNEINTEEIELLMTNRSEKLMLFNIWATWSKPCEDMYSELIDIYRIYRMRDLMFVSVSIDSIKDRESVLKFINSKNSSGQNYIFTDPDYSYIPAGVIDSDWSGILPYAVLVEPGGNIIFRMNDVADTLELKRTIVEHALMGRYP